MPLLRALRPLIRAATLIAAVLAVPAALLAVPASAASGSTPPSQWSRSLPYSCDFSAYGVADPVKMTATLRLPTLVIPGRAAQVSIAVPAITPPAAAGQALSEVTSVTAGEPGSAEPPDASTQLPLTLRGAAAAMSPAQLPAVIMAAAVTFGHAGYYDLDRLGSLTITPATASGSLTAITCTLTTGAPLGVNPITVAIPGQLVPPGPLYRCAYGQGEYGLAFPLDMTLTATGSHQTRGSATLVLTTDPGLLASYGILPRTYYDVTARLPVTGAQTGQIPLSEHTTDVSSTAFRLTGALSLTRPGADRVWFPPSLTVVQGFAARGTSPASTVVLHCVLAPAQGQTWIPLTVTGNPASPSTSATTAAGGASSGQGSGTAATGAVPAGAPGTGGGTAPGRDLPLALTGAALLLLGGGALWYADRRRQATR